MDFQSSFSEALRCNGQSEVYLERWALPFNPHFQRLFAATYKHTPLVTIGMVAFNPHFQRLFAATNFKTGFWSGGPSFQSSFSEALRCNRPWPVRSRPPFPLSILIFRGSSLQRKNLKRLLRNLLNFQSSFSEALRCNSVPGFGSSNPASTFNPHFQRLFAATLNP